MNTVNALHPIQPNFALDSSYYYKKVMADSPYSHFYQFQANADRNWMSVVPDATMDIIFECGEKRSNARVYGMVLQNCKVAFKKDNTYFGVRFLPGFIPGSWRGALPELIQGVLPMEQLGLAGLENVGITAGMDFNNKIDLFMEAFSSRKTDYLSNGLFAQLMGMIFDCGGNITVERLEKETGYSRRYIHMVFMKNIGIAPKAFTMVVKFQRAIQAINRGEYVSFSDVAATMGYYDQSQFTEDFKRFTTLTPKQYSRMIQERRYDSLISEY